MIHFDENKLMQLHNADELLNEKYGEEGTEKAARHSMRKHKPIIMETFCVIGAKN